MDAAVAHRATVAVGISGPVLLTTAWAVLGTLTPGYSQLDQSISSVAAIGRPYAHLMVAAFAWQGIAQLCVARLALGAGYRRTALALAVSAVGTAGVGLLPLPAADGPASTAWLGPAHSVAATVAFAALHLAALSAAADRGLPPRLRALAGTCLLLALPGTAWFLVNLGSGAPGYGLAEKAMTTVLLVVPCVLVATLPAPARERRPVP